ncbi:MAG: hypothetical protein HY912_16260, partial [Desulfomonile tiedjei]|nr:hypothetical protein [Desulfomonile tiedjei]
MKMVSRNYPYFVSALILLAAVPLGWFAGAAFAGCTAILAGASFLQTRFMLAKVRKAEQERQIMDDQICRIEKLSTVDELSAGIAHEIN